MNTSKFSINSTASTNLECATQRAENLSILGATNVIELCVGPSLAILEQAYKRYGIKVTGNDIDPKYKDYYKEGNWVIGHCFSINVNKYDYVVFAPPLSKGCSGKRKDALSFWEVDPSFQEAANIFRTKLCLTLPGKTLSIKQDRSRLYKFLSQFAEYQIMELRNKVTKYIDIYV